MGRQRIQVVTWCLVFADSSLRRRLGRVVVPRLSQQQQLLGRLILSLQWRLWRLGNAIQHRQQDSNFNLWSAQDSSSDTMNNNLLRQLRRPPDPRLDSIECRSGGFSRLDSIEHRAPKGANHIHVGLRPPHEPSARVTCKRSIRKKWRTPQKNMLKKKKKKKKKKK